MKAMNVACVVMALLGTGCALLNKSEPIVPRYFNPEVADRSVPRVVASGTGLELRIGRVNADTYITDRLVHRDSAYEIGYYDDRVWTEKPEAYVRRALTRALFDARGVRQRLSGVGTTLDVDVVAFEEVLAPVHVARVELSYEVYDDRVVRLARSVVVERPIALAKGSAEAKEAVQALSEALVVAVDAVADAATGELRAEEAPENPSTKTAE
jgi:cholesterol transport system auxiliary component